MNVNFQLSVQITDQSLQICKTASFFEFLASFFQKTYFQFWTEVVCLVYVNLILIQNKAYRRFYFDDWRI